MKRFLHLWMAVVATLAMISPAIAQNNANGLSEIGSYQSILSRAGYSTADEDGGGGYRAAGIYVAPAETIAGSFNEFNNNTQPPGVGAMQEKTDTKETVIIAPTNENAQPEPMAGSVRLTNCDCGGCADCDRYFVYDCDAGYCGSYTYTGRPECRPFFSLFRHRH